MKKVKMEKWLIGVYVLEVIACIFIYLATDIKLILVLGFIAFMGIGFQILRYLNAKKEIN
ncbi:hypothetical protein C1903_00265 [Listeria ivanovii]|nr:hypothetical protein C1905_00255 [Listeria ivanovii]PZF96940.1 hypothetical protein C1903_00265 [Listeria ivanovii]PZG06971.1 hypothetical protein C2L88_00595 [Listeria ivanovii]PZG11946.1 hypothetical protein C1901_00260 [Listeria ivanovii]PZG29073.1 hypothetical protein C1900_00255 [Listeria ivanovii]